MRILSRFCIALLSLIAIPGLARGSDTHTIVINGSSMQPTLHSQDEIEIDTLDRFTVIERQQLVVIRFKNRERRMLKRVYALPGDNLQIVDGKFLLNQENVKPVGWIDSYQLSDAAGKALRVQLKHYDNVLPSNKYLLLGDNFRRSRDSLDYGLVERDQIEGIARH